jgi:hypothetical protein
MVAVNALNDGLSSVPGSLPACVLGDDLKGVGLRFFIPPFR